MSGKWKPMKEAPKNELIIIRYNVDEVGTGLHWLGDEWSCDQEEVTVVPTGWQHMPSPYE